MDLYKLYIELTNLYTVRSFDDMCECALKMVPET